MGKFFSKLTTLTRAFEFSHQTQRLISVYRLSNEDHRRPKTVWINDSKSIVPVSSLGSSYPSIFYFHFFRPEHLLYQSNHFFIASLRSRPYFAMTSQQLHQRSRRPRKNTRTQVRELGFHKMTKKFLLQTLISSKFTQVYQKIVSYRTTDHDNVKMCLFLCKINHTQILFYSLFFNTRVHCTWISF